MNKEKLLTICREISEHKYTWGRGYRLIIKLYEENKRYQDALKRAKKEAIRRTKEELKELK